MLIYAPEAQSEQALNILKSCDAFLEGHFLLRSGEHSPYYCQCARLGERLDKMSEVVALAAPLLEQYQINTVLAPAMGALVYGQELARQLGKRFLFVEKVDDKLTLRRNFKINPGERILVAEDVVTRGGRAKEALDIIEAHGGTPVGVSVILNRGKPDMNLGYPIISLIKKEIPSYPADQLPPELANTPVVKPGS